jgi:dynein heavy chain 1
VKEEQLREKDIVANQKLQKMVENKNEAEHRKTEAESLSIELHYRDTEIARRREEVEKELSEAEPALQLARTSVRAIKPAQLNEVRALARPPNGVRLTMEAVCVMLGERTTEIRRIIRGRLY